MRLIWLSFVVTCFRDNLLSQFSDLVVADAYGALYETILLDTFREFEKFNRVPRASH